MSRNRRPKLWLKILAWIAGVILFWVLLVLSLGYFFRENIQRYCVEELAKKLNASIEVEDVRFAPFRSWPDISIEIRNLNIHLSEEAAQSLELKNREFYRARNMRFQVYWRSFFSSQYVIRKITVVEPTLYLYANRQGSWNWEKILEEQNRHGGSTGRVSQCVSRDMGKCCHAAAAS